MAGTRVRYSRESFVFCSAQLIKGLDLAAQFGSLARPDTLLGVFIGLQMAESVLLTVTGRLDLPVAGCLSASLLTAAALFNRQHNAPAGEHADTLIPAGRSSDSSFDCLPAGILPCLRAAAPPTPRADTVAHMSELMRDGITSAPVTAAPTPAASQPPAKVNLPQASAPPTTGICEHSQPWADLMARISHEIRTPLNAVIGFSDLMGREIFGPLGNPRYADYVVHIKESGDALLKSAEDTLALSSMLATPDRTQHPQSSDLAALALDAWRYLEPAAARRGISLDMAVASPLDIAGDRRAYRQIVVNLMCEALHMAADGTEITISASAQGCSVKLTVEAHPHPALRRTAGASLQICVARALLERLGCPLVIGERPGSWQAATVIELVTQPDFFPTQGCSSHVAPVGVMAN